MGKFKEIWKAATSNHYDIRIWEVQILLDKAEKILNLIENDSNPAYLKKLTKKYFKEKNKIMEVSCPKEKK